MKQSLVILFFLFVDEAVCYAQQIKGGWIDCQYSGDNAGDKTSGYLITVNIYGRGQNDPILNLWDAGTGGRVKNLSTSKLDTYGNAAVNKFSSCANTSALNNAYSIKYVPFEVVLPANPNGYFIGITFRAPPFAGRDTSIKNIYDPGGTGILFSTNILGTNNGIDYHKNSSPLFKFVDTVSVCRNTSFSFQCSAFDPNGDSLSYSFGDAIQMAFDTTSPPLFPVQYNAPCSGPDPFGNGITMDPVTGFVSGTAPDIPGGYAIAVYVQEWRSGVLINTTRKESMIKVVSCPFAAPLLKPLYSSCLVNTFTFKNELTCPDITSWHWDFGDTTSFGDTSNLAMPTYTYPGLGAYKLKLKVSNNYGYIDSAFSIVKVLDEINIKLGADTGICKSDTITLKPTSDANTFLWRESGGSKTLNNYNIQNPKASPVANATTYYVTAQLNNCKDSAQTTVYASPYPKANAGADTTICLGDKASLSGTISGAVYTWSPTNLLLRSNTLQPVAFPQKTTAYILSVTDTFYCPKVVRDTVIVKVLPSFTVDAGKDDAVVIGQTYRLNALAIGNTEIVKYTWQSSPYLNSTTILNPDAAISAGAPDVITFKATATTIVGSCSATDEVSLKVYKIAPDILVPSAFTPNGDGKNDVLKPLLIGITKLDYFNVYNRYGRLVYSTVDKESGWDGRIGNVPQSSGAYVFVTQGKDYLGKTIFKKGTVVLVR